MKRFIITETVNYEIDLPDEHDCDTALNHFRQVDDMNEFFNELEHDTCHFLDYLCSSCNRPESICSEEPCDQVKADRQERTISLEAHGRTDQDSRL